MYNLSICLSRFSVVKTLKTTARKTGERMIDVLGGLGLESVSVASGGDWRGVGGLEWWN